MLKKQNKTKQNKTKQNKTKQNKTKQNKTKQNKTQDISFIVALMLLRNNFSSSGRDELYQPANKYSLLPIFFTIFLFLCLVTWGGAKKVVSFSLFDVWIQEIYAWN